MILILGKLIVCVKIEILIFFKNMLCVPNCPLRDLLAMEFHGVGLMGHFLVAKSLEILHERLFWPDMKKKDIERIVSRCHTCRDAKFRVPPNVLYSPLSVPIFTCIDNTMDFVSG